MYFRGPCANLWNCYFLRKIPSFGQLITESRTFYTSKWSSQRALAQSENHINLSDTFLLVGWCGGKTRKRHQILIENQIQFRGATPFHPLKSPQPERFLGPWWSLTWLLGFGNHWSWLKPLQDCTCPNANKFSAFSLDWIDQILKALIKSWLLSLKLLKYQISV